MTNKKRITWSSASKIGHIDIDADSEVSVEGNSDVEPLLPTGLVVDKGSPGTPFKEFEGLLPGDVESEQAKSKKLEKPDANEIYRQIEEAVANQQNGRVANMLLEVNPKDFVYSETNINTWETINYVVKYSFDEYGLKCDWNHKSTQVTVNEEFDEEPLMMPNI